MLAAARARPDLVAQLVPSPLTLAWDAAVQDVIRSGRCAAAPMCRSWRAWWRLHTPHLLSLQPCRDVPPSTHLPATGFPFLRPGWGG